MARGRCWRDVICVQEGESGGEEEGWATAKRHFIKETSHHQIVANCKLNAGGGPLALALSLSRLSMACLGARLDDHACERHRQEQHPTRPDMQPHLARGADVAFGVNRIAIPPETIVLNPRVSDRASEAKSTL